MFLQSYLYYQLRALYGLLVDHDECLDVPATPELLRYGITETLSTADLVYLNSLELMEEFDPVLFEVIERVTGALHYLSRLDDFADVGSSPIFSAWAEDSGFSEMECAGFDEPWNYSAHGVFVEGRGYLQLAFPLTCGREPVMSYGVYTEEDAQAVLEYARKYGLSVRFVDIKDFYHAGQFGFLDSVMCHVLGLDDTFQHRLRAHLFTQSWNSHLWNQKQSGIECS